MWNSVGLTFPGEYQVGGGCGEGGVAERAMSSLGITARAGWGGGGGGGDARTQRRRGGR